ncbi:MAG: UDP-N-acetylmuramoyl-tripeptide--D-alanyl-D-alanine ligase [Clostridiales bacterium]|nr:UDP-N-acetylmuramoyl-tripeptide--D-alanyl-D-alanine ligase [Clostridiales bacterium]
MADEEDIVVVAGKGHETTMTIGKDVVRFVDSEVTSEVLRELEAEKKEKRVKFTLKEVVDVTGGELLQFEGKSEENLSGFVVDGVSTDTRELEEGNLFLALIGENFDGNTYAAKAADAGARALVLSTMEYAPKDIPVVLVPDTKIALEKLAECYRKRLGCKVIAVTGSVGKTSTRQMIFSALSTGCKADVTKHNNNNEIGLSKTILATPCDTEVLVLEMGMRARGEISELTHIAHPDVAVITNIGVSHMEILGTQEAIMHAKLEVLECLKEGGLLIIPYADPMLQKAVREGLVRDDVKIAYTSTEDISFPDRAYGTAVADQIRSEDNRIFCRARAGFGTIEETALCVRAVGLHHASNALAGLLCGLYLQIPTEKITEGIKRFCQIGHRERSVDVSGIHFLDDAYNAGPESMMAAFESIRRLAKDGKAYACIGDMLELGDESERQHFAIGKKAAEVGLNGILVLGDFKDTVRRGVESVSADIPVYCFDNKKEMAEGLHRIVKKGDYVLLKASHFFAMYTIADEYDSIVRGGSEQ